MANPFFNAKYYLEQNADVAEAVGGDEAIAEQHYFLHGAAEADEGTNTARKPAPWFDIEFYRASNEDLADVPADQLFLHFTLYGIGEGRSPMEGVEFDAAAYAAAEGNEDLLEAFGIEDVDALTEDQVELLAQHFYAHGYIEGRAGGPEIPGWNDDSGLGELAEALSNLQAANQEVADFLESTPALESDNVDVEAGEATADDVRTYVADVEAEVDDALGNPAGFLDLDDAAQDEYVAAAEQILAAEVSMAKAGQPANLETLLTNAETARENLLAAVKATNAATKHMDAQIAAFEDYNDLTVVTDIDTYDPAVDNSGSVFVSNGKVYVGQDGTGTPVAFEDLEEAAADTPFVAELIAANAAVVKADAAEIAAESTLQSAVGKVYVAVNKAYAVATGEDFAGVIAVDDTEGAEEVTIDYTEALDLYETRADATADDATALTADAAADLAEALVAQAEFAALVQRFQEARDLDSTLTDLEEAAADARAAIENPVDDADAPGLGITLVDVEAAVVAIADIEEVFLFTAETAGDITGFGAEDLLFFGADYTFVELGADVDFASERVGASDVLEIFYQVQGTNTVFYVENEVEAGRDLNLDNITVVELTGVAGELNIVQELGFVGLA